MLMVAIFSVFTLSGCLVAESKYIKKVEESDKLSRELSALMEHEQTLTREKEDLQNRIKALNTDLATLNSEMQMVAAEKDKVTEELKTELKEKEAINKAIEKVTTDRDALDKVLKSRSDTFSKTIRGLRAKITAFEEETAFLKEDVSDLEAEKATLEQLLAASKTEYEQLRQDTESLKKTKGQEVQTLSKTYEDLLQEMKSEVAQGQVTITELKGKLTLDVLDEILFDSGQAEIKPKGLAVLQRVIDILKKVKDKLIRIEGHTDNIPIRGALSKKYATNWELSAARATNITRYLQNQGIDPLILSAAAYGEYRPVADNGTPEGRAKNRRIAIILLPKD
jgi:chemotaxis protein MotB